MTREREILTDLQQRKRTIDIDGERHWIVEGDLVLNEFRLRQYAQELAAEEAARAASPVSAGLRQPGLRASAGLDGILRWAPGKVLDYAILAGSFPERARYEQAARELQLAAGAWEAVCGVRFRHLRELDDTPDIGPDAAVFRVRYQPDAGGLIASAFFPDWPPEERWVNIYGGYFASNPGFELVGVLRHELGHVLGFRHEHTHDDAPMDCPDEPLADTRALTDYDPESVMHYFCGGLGNRALELTELDKRGAQAVYGPSFVGFDMVD